MRNLLVFVVFLFSTKSFALESFEILKKEYESLLDKKYILLPHKENYLIPLSYNFKPNNSSYSVLTSPPELQERGDYNRNLEAEFQISFMFVTPN